jgi:hypothetical protein
MKKINLSFLFVATLTALAFHVGGILWLEHSPLSWQQSSYKNVLKTHSEIRARAQQRERTEFLAEIFNQLAPELPPPTKIELSELKAEYVPHLELTFPSELPVILAETPFSFQTDLMENAPLNEGVATTRSTEGETPLIAPLPSFTSIDIPPLANIEIGSHPFDDFGTLASSEHFDIEIEYAPKQSRPGYVFKITLLPHGDVHFKRIRQNFFFLLDRSNSIPRARYALNKRAVSEALTFLMPGDRFNILVFDDRVIRFQPREVEWSEYTVAEARNFLETQAHGGFFAATELYASLGKIIPHNVAENEINTAILLSDGDTYLSQEKQRLTIGRWTEQNKGKVSLFTLASGTGNNLPLLELLSGFNKGALIYAQDHEDIFSRMAFLMRTLQHPIGKKIVATAIPEDQSMVVLLQPKQARIPDLYQHRPFVLYGTTNKLSDFILFIQGRYYDHLFDIKKRVSFSKAKLGSYSLERGWTQLLVQEFYEKYFQEGNFTHLEAAKQLLLPLNLPTPLIE